MARKIAVIDAETDPFKIGRTQIAPFIWGLYDGEEYHYFENTRFDNGSVVHDCTKKLMQFLSDKNYIVYAHNGGKFDYHFFLDHVDPWQPVKIINSRLASFKVGKCEFRDSYNILPVPLSAFKKDEMDYAIMEAEERYKKENDKKIKDYLKGDCIYLHSMVSQFIDEYGMNLTIAGASMKQWEKRYERKAPRSSQKYYDKFKAYYYGGRVQCFKTGHFKMPFKMADINSAYPRAMLDKHPIDTEYTTLNNPPDSYWKPFIKRSYLGHSFFTVVAKSRGAFPWRAPKGSLFFPDDNKPRVFDITGWELQAALRTGTADIINVLTIHSFNTVDSFTDYIMHFYKKRLIAKDIVKKCEENGDKESHDYLKAKAQDIFCKLFMNSLYGKFGSEPRNYSEYLVMPDAFFEALLIAAQNLDMDPYTLLEEMDIMVSDVEAAKEYDAFDYDFGGTMGDLVLGARDVPESKQRYFNVATAASITGWVRAYLWEHICKSDTPLYCDTDSIAAVGFNDFPFGKELGEWEIEGEFIEGSIGGKKLYAFKKAPEWVKPDETPYKTASKGVRLDAEQIVRVAKGETVTYTPMAPTFSLLKAPHFVSRDVKVTSTELPKIDEKLRQKVLTGEKALCNDSLAVREYSGSDETPELFSVCNSENGDFTYLRWFPNLRAAKRDFETMTKGI